MNSFSLLNITQNDRQSNKNQIDLSCVLKEKLGQNISLQQNCIIISIIGDRGTGKSYVFQNLLKFLSQVNTDNQNEIKAHESNENQEDNDDEMCTAIQGSLTHNFKIQEKNHTLLLLDCNFNLEKENLCNLCGTAQESICSFIQGISHIVIYTTTDVTLSDINANDLLSNLKYNLNAQKICLIINKQTKNDIAQLVELEDNNKLINKFHQVIYLTLKNDSKLLKNCSQFSLLFNYINQQCKIQQQSQTLNEIVLSMQEKLEEINKQINQQLIDAVDPSIEIIRGNEQKEDSICEIISQQNQIKDISPSLKQFNLISLVNHPQKDIKDYQITLNKQVISLLKGEYKDKKCSVTSFLGLKGCGKSTLAHQYIKLIEPSIKNEELEQLKNKQNGNCLMIVRDEILHLIIDSDELFGFCESKSNLISQIISKLQIQCIIDKVSDYSFYVKNSIRLVQKESETIQGFKELQKFMFGKINSNSTFVFNRLTNYEYQELENNKCKVKIISDNYAKIKCIRVNTELCKESLSNEVSDSNSKDQIKQWFKDDVEDLIKDKQEGVLSQTSFDFINNLQQSLNDCLSSEVNNIKTPLCQFIQDLKQSLKDDCLSKIQEEIEKISDCYYVSQGVLDYLKKQIINNEKEFFNNKLKKLIHEQFKNNKGFDNTLQLRQKIIGVYCKHFQNKKLLEDLTNQDSYDQIQTIELDDFDLQSIKSLTTKILPIKQQNINFQKGLRFITTFFGAGDSQKMRSTNYQHIKGMLEESCSPFSLNKSSFVKDLFRQDYSGTLSADDQKIIQMIIKISQKVVELKQRSTLVEDALNWKIDDILPWRIDGISNLLGLGSEILDQIKSFCIHEQDLQKFIQHLKDNTMDQFQFKQILQQVTDDNNFKQEIPNIELSENSLLMESKEIEEKEKIWYSLLSIQLIDGSFVLERICIPLLLKMLDESKIKLYHHFLDIYKLKIN